VFDLERFLPESRYQSELRVNVRNSLVIVAMLVALCLSNCSKKTDPPDNGSGSAGNQNLQIPSPTPSLSPTPTERDLSLKEAIDRKLVATAICGVGASSGRALIIVIKSLIEDRLNLKVDEALSVTNGDGDYQDMVLDKVEEQYDEEMAQEIAEQCVEAAEKVEDEKYWKKTDNIALSGYETRVYSFSAYCLDFEKRNPESSNTFTGVGDADPEIKLIFRHVRQHPGEFKLTPIQLATWAIRGNFGVEDIQPKFGFTDTDRSDACRLLQSAGVHVATKRLCAN
jgi:hypothetical protein